MAVYTESVSYNSVIFMLKNKSWRNLMRMLLNIDNMMKSNLLIHTEIECFLYIFSDSVLGRASSGFKRKGQRIFVFIVGGATRSEVLKLTSLKIKFVKIRLISDTFCVFLQLRVCHKLTEKLDREVILGSSSFLDPQTFLTVWNLFT